MHLAKGGRQKISDDDADHVVNISGYDYSIQTMTSSVGFLFRAAYLQIKELLRVTEQFEIKPAMFELLRITHENPGIRQAHAARLLLIQESNMATLVRDAFKLGLLGRLDERGKRRHGLWLSSHGKEMLDDMAAIAEKVEQQYLAVLDPDEEQALRTILSRAYKSGLDRKSEGELDELAENGVDSA